MRLSLRKGPLGRPRRALFYFLCSFAEDSALTCLTIFGVNSVSIFLRVNWRNSVLIIYAVISLSLIGCKGCESIGSGPSNTLTGYTECRWGMENCNVCVNSVERAADNLLRNRGDILGFYLGEGVPNPNYTFWNRHNHWQGIQRIPIDNGRWLAVSYDDTGEGPGGVGFVHLPSRIPVEQGGRLRSNRLGNTHVEFTQPPLSDRILSKVDSGTNSLQHAGGMQALGHYLAVPYEGTASDSEVRIYDVSIPQRPSLAYTLQRTSKPNSGAVGWVMLDDGRYLLMVGGSDSKPLDFYLSSSIIGPYTLHDSWTGSIDALQNSNIVTECSNGSLYIIGNHKNIWSGRDWIELYQLRVPRSSGSVSVTKKGSRHVYCSYGPIPKQCDMNAAGGAYVSATNELFYYATEHDNNGPLGSIKMEEFRPVWPNATTCQTDISGAWVELYDDHSFEDRGIIIDYVDRNLEDYSNYDNIERFGDKASSARWCLPSGVEYQLCDDDGHGDCDRTLRGRSSDFNFGDSSGDVKNWGDKTSSSRW